jgi:hypothetical protein
MTPPPPAPGLSGPYRVLWTVWLDAPPDLPPRRLPIAVRAGSQDTAIRTVLSHRPGWRLARDLWQNPLVIRHPTPDGPNGPRHVGDPRP